MFGNADAIGILNAFKVLDENPLNSNLKLSDVFTLYYKGVSFLRAGISLLTTPSKEFYTSGNRWKAFSKHFGFYRKDTSGNYFWVPGNATEWNKVMADYSTSNPNGRDYEKRLFGFSEFWNTTIYKSLLLLDYEYYYFRALIFANLEVPQSLISKYESIGNFNSSGQSQDVWVKNITKNLLQSKFLSFVKNKTI